MVAYIREHLGVDADEATRIRQDYWQRYGATLLGLMRHHGTDPQHFLWHTHQFPDLKHMLVLERALRAMLLRLPGRKIVFSNAPLHYSEAVLELAGIAAVSTRSIPSSASASNRNRRWRLPPPACAASVCRRIAASWSKTRWPICDRQATGHEDRLGEWQTRASRPLSTCGWFPFSICRVVYARLSIGELL
jgi:hypothetical protein